MQRSKNDSCRVPFHTISDLATAAGVLAITANPAGLSPRALAEADAWSQFRIASLRFRLHPAAAGSVAAGFAGGLQVTAPGTVTQVGELIPSCSLGAVQVVPTEWVVVGRTELSGPFPWYKTIASAGIDDSEEAPGALYIASAAAITAFQLEIRGVFEFKVAVATANTPSEVALRAKLREERVMLTREVERRRLLAALSVASSSTTNK